MHPQRSFGQSDSTAVYRSIHEYARKHKFTRWIYSGIFVPVEEGEEPPPSAPRTVRKDPFAKYAGRVVRHIEVRTFDPFGYSVDDTAMAPVNVLQTWGNRLHRRTRPRIVRNLLLVKPLQRLEPLKVSESERVLRASPFVNDARIVVQPVGQARDSVDLLVLVHDKWSVDVSGEADLTSASGTVQERNFLGWGQRLEQRVGYVLGESSLHWSGSHEVYNIERSHASSYLYYSFAPDENQVGFSLQRPFFSPLTKWAGGISWSETWAHYRQYGTDGSILLDLPLRPASLDLWGGRSFRLGDGSEPGSSNSNFVLAGRYAQTRYADRPPASYDPEGVYSNYSMFLLGVGLSIRQYYKERYLFRFGNSEDVPEGLLLSFTAGVAKRELTVNQPYLGAEISRGRNYPGLGYLSADVAFGAFWARSGAENGTGSLRLLYFSDLRSMGRWHFRQFLRFNATYGINKPSYSTLYLGGSELYGFPGGELEGTHKELLRSETVFYAPWSWLGFRVAPVFLAGFGTLGRSADPLFSGRIYSSLSLGLLVRNENLLVRTFEVTLGFYPYVPGSTGAAFRVNGFDSYSAGAWDFTFQEPAVVAYE
jgi:hypothetical protein